MALQPAYGFVPYGFRGLPAAPAGYGFGEAAAKSRFVVVQDRYGDKHAAELGPGERPERAARVLANDLGLDRYDVVKWSVVRARDAGAARLMGAGVREGAQLELFSDTVEEKPRRKGVSRKPGRTARCKNVKMTLKSGKTVRRKLCWDKHGVLTSNTRAGARSAGNRKVVCKRKCKNGGRAVCTGGYRKIKGRKVCKKFVCRKR
jgi:hypothetical protein